MNAQNSVGFEKSLSQFTKLQKRSSMQKLLKALVMVGVGLGGAASAQGASHGSHHGSSHASAAHRSHSAGSHKSGSAHGHPHATQHNGRSASHHNYHLTNGRQFRGGYYYPGRNHRHWAYTVYDSRYGCTLYYDPDLRCYYYWCEPDGCYYPVSYAPYNRYVWSTVNDEHHDDEARELQTDLDALSAKLR